MTLRAPFSISDLDTQTEPELIARAVSGVPGAVDRLLLDQRQRVLAYLERRLPNDLREIMEPQDVLQDTYFEVVRHIGGFVPDGDDSLYRWMVTIARNRMLQLLRMRRSAKRGGGRIGVPTREESAASLLNMLAVSDRTPSRSAAAHELAAELDRHIAALSSDGATAVRLRHLEGLTVRQIAERMGRSEGAVHQLCHRGLRELRRRMRTAAFYP